MKLNGFSHRVLYTTTKTFQERPTRRRRNPTLLELQDQSSYNRKMQRNEREIESESSFVVEEQEKRSLSSCLTWFDLHLISRLQFDSISIWFFLYKDLLYRFLLLSPFPSLSPQTGLVWSRRRKKFLSDDTQLWVILVFHIKCDWI